MQPISQKREAQYKGPSSSEDFNQWMDENYFDLIQLFNFAAEYGIKIPKNMQMLVLENVFLQKRIGELEAYIDNIEASLADSSYKNLLHTFTEEGGLSASVDGGETFPLLDHDTEYGLVKIPHIQEVSKLYLTNLNQENFVPKTLNAKIYEANGAFDIALQTIEGAEIVEDSATNPETFNMFDGNKNTFFQRKVTKPIDVGEIYFCVEIDLPTNIVNHTRANVITIDPTPLASLSLLDIQFKTTVDWQRLPSYPMIETGGEMQPKVLTELNRMRFCFPSRDMVAVRFYFKQPNWFLENGQRSFFYGFRNIDVNYMAFNTDNNFRMRVKFDIPDPDKSFTSIINADSEYPVIPVFSDGSIQIPNLFEVYGIYVNDTRYDFGDTLPMGTKSVEIDIGLVLSNEISPLLSGVIIKYE